MATKELTNKQITACLKDFTLPSMPLYTIYPDKEFMLPRLDAFLEMVKYYLKNQ